MTLLWCDSMDGYAGGNNVAPIPVGIVAAKYGTTNVETAWRLLSSGGDFGYAIKLPASTSRLQMETGDLTANDTTIAGVSYLQNTGVNWVSKFDWPLFNFQNTSGDECCGLYPQQSGSFYLKDATGNYIGGIRHKTQFEVFHYIEMKVLSHTTNGTIEVRVNGCPVFTATDVATATGNGTVTHVALGHNTTVTIPFGFARLDNFYMCDGAGSTNNDFLDPVRIDALWPDGDDTAQFATTGNANYATNYEQVDQKRARPTTDWVMDDSSGNRDLYTMDNLSADYDAIHGVAAWAHGQYDTNPATIHFLLDSNGTEVESANIVLGSALTTEGFIVELDPDTASAWTPSTINALKSGYEVQ